LTSTREEGTSDKGKNGRKKSEVEYFKWSIRREKALLWCILQARNLFQICKKFSKREPGAKY